MIRLIISDIDATLIDQSGYLPPENVVALGAAAARGVRLALATIRKHDLALQIARQLGVPCTLVCNGGATIFDEHGATLRALSIPLEIAQAIAALADQQGLPLLATIDELNYYRPGYTRPRILPPQASMSPRCCPRSPAHPVA
ncbi:MAG: HAD family hydrolase [Kouleothrix sp.]